MREEGHIKLQQIKALERSRKFPILLPAMLFIISWMIISAAIIAHAAEYEASEVDKPPKLVRKMDPKYPLEAKRKKMEGRVVVRCLITVKGKADKIEVVESEPEGIFDESAMRSIKYWSFRPGVLNGEMVDTWVKIPLTFKP
jgi:protein TonB